MRAIRVGYAIAAGVLVVAYFLLPGVRPAVVATVGALGVVAIVFGVALFRPPRAGAWLMIAVGAALVGIGDVVFAVMAGHTRVPPRFPGAPDAFYLAAYLPLALGLLWLGQSRLPSRDWPMILDTAALSLAGSLLFWIALLRPALAQEDVSGVARGLAIASWVGYVAVLAASARVSVAWRANLSLALLSAGVIGYLVSHFLYGRELLARSWTVGRPVDLGFLAFSVLCGGAALTRSMTRVASAVHARHRLSPSRLAMLATGLLIAPTVLLVETTAGQVTTPAAIAIVSGSVGILVLVRLSMSVRAYQQRAAREQTAREASRAMLLAATDADVVAGLRDALRGLVPARENADVRLVDRDERAAPEGLSSLDGNGELALPVADQSERMLVYAAPTSELVELDAILRALADQAGTALDRIRLTDDLHAQERERYFRTLVLTSDDVTLISRDGRVVYATPSAEAMFGRDVTGAQIDDLVLSERPDAPEADERPERGAGVDGYVYRDGRVVDTLVRSRDLTADPSVGGVVTTLRDVSAERRMQRDLAFRASHDALTGLANPKLFHEQLRTGAGHAVLFIDLDDFKSVNDTYGHDMGDQLLMEAARRIESCLRHGDLAARIGGDEFAVLLRHASGDGARGVAQRLAGALAEPYTRGSVTVDCKASVGLAHTDDHYRPTALMRRADTALYSAKAAGKGQWREYASPDEPHGPFS